MYGVLSGGKDNSFNGQKESLSFFCNLQNAKNCNQ